ncbi:MAG: bifunctional phosphoribosyl-AMP cyclohydrolase/phosphoribosyl-ATP diphosphatase HisIE [Oscillospiraceae bacterium]
MIEISTVKFDDKGLVPAIVQDFRTKEVLTLAYMNRESLEISTREKRTCFYSRSRQELWRKGETSGNVQEIVAITADCDSDALLVEVRPAGPACHTGEVSCFHQPIWEKDELQRFSMDALYSLILGRKTEKKEGSYTTYLFEKGDDKILKKVGEECTEVVIAAKNNDNAELVYEIADLAYHTMVLMVQKGIGIDEIRSELASRHVVDKKVKQEKMQ